MFSTSETWGTTAGERRLLFPCDNLISDHNAELYRGVSIAASPRTVFRWLCQLRVAPYSYDWIDNGGQKSPQSLTPGLDDLEVGQEVMQIFALLGFEIDKHLTLILKQRSRLFGQLAVSYLVVADEARKGSSRLLAKLVVRYPATLSGKLMSIVLPWGDLVMMRRQLLNLKALAEKTEKAAEL